MYPGKYAVERAEQPCFIMANSGEIVTYGEFENRTNKLAHLLRDQGLAWGDHYAIFMENNSRYLEMCGAGERAGLQYTCVNSHLTADEVAYIVNDCEARVFVTSAEKLSIARAAVEQCPKVERWFVVGATTPLKAPFEDYSIAVSAYPHTPVADEHNGAAMLYSSGTTGRPKGILRELLDMPPGDALEVFQWMADLWRFREGQMYLSPAPLYHSAPLGAVGLTIRMGGTVIIMERFDAEQYLQLVETYGITHSQLVPTMFSRMLKLPDDVRSRYDLSSLEWAVHASAPCPVPVKEAMINWWGPKLLEYYGATESIGFTACDSVEWMAHKGTVGRAVLGVVHILDDEFQSVPNGTQGAVWFESPVKLTYWNDPVKTEEATSPDGAMHTTGDIGYVDDDGWLFLSDRKSFMIISGGVNIYPQETENLLITHPSVADAAVFGVPNTDLGEERKAVVQPMPGIEGTKELENELIDFCRQNLSKQKCPRSIDFQDKLPRMATGKLYKKDLRDKYWKKLDTIAQ